MIRHHDGTTDSAQKISAQSKRGAVWALVWTHRKHRVFLQRNQAEKARQAWKTWKERHGFEVVGNFALKDGRRVEACVVHKYDPPTRERVE